MKEEAISLARNIADPGKRLNVLREYLQVLALKALYGLRGAGDLLFLGGTALRLKCSALYQSLPKIGRRMTEMGERLQAQTSLFGHAGTYILYGRYEWPGGACKQGLQIRLRGNAGQPGNLGMQLVCVDDQNFTAHER